jgi:hypothetical protein
MPHPRHREVYRLEVGTDPVETWDAVRSLDLYSIRYIRTLLRLRGATGARATFDEIVKPGNGFHRLAEIPGKRFVAGAVGKFWKRHIPFVDVTPEAFTSFAEPGYGKVAWSVEIDPRGEGGSWITIELRIDATSEDAWRSFMPYWIAIGRFSRSIRRSLLRHLRQRFGPAPADDLRSLPGDTLLPVVQMAHTEAITIDAPCEEVWSRLARLDHLSVLDREPPSALVLGSPSLLESTLPRSRGALGLEYDLTWAFFLEPIGDATRVIARIRASFEPTIRSELVGPFVAAVHALRDASELRHLKERTEAHHHAA